MKAPEHKAGVQLPRAMPTPSCLHTPASDKTLAHIDMTRRNTLPESASEGAILSALVAILSGISLHVPGVPTDYRVSDFEIEGYSASPRRM
jgi:hypothetical protein